MTFVAMKEPAREIAPGSVPAMLAKAFRAASRNPRADLRPDLDLPLVVREGAVDPRNVQAFQSLTRDRTFEGAVPPGYLFRLAFPNIAAIVVDEKFPLPAFGTLHKDNVLTIKKPVRPDPDAIMRVSTRLRSFEQADTKLNMDLATDFSIDGDQVAAMTSIITSLNRPRLKGSASQQPPSPGEDWLKVAEIDLPVTLGWSFARVSDDWNLHHVPYMGYLTGLGALIKNPARMPREFERHTILQGACSSSMAVGALPCHPMQKDGRGTLQTSYLAPVPLPSKQEVWTRQDGQAVDFALRDPRQNRRVLVQGRISGPSINS